MTRVLVQVLKLRSCVGLTGRFLKHVTRANQLQSIHLSGCPQLKPGHLAHLSRCRRLKFADLCGGPYQDKADVEALGNAIRVIRAACPRLVQVRTRHAF